MKWFVSVHGLKCSLSSLHDNDQREAIRNMICEKDKKYDEMIFISSKGEYIIPKLSTIAREKIKTEIKVVKDQWHEIFDDLIRINENIEERIQKNDSLKEILQRTKLQFDRIKSTFNEEVRKNEPIKIIFSIGIDEKEKQLRKLEEIMQNVSGMSYTIQKLETVVQSEDDTELEYQISSFIKEFYTLSEVVNIAKDMSSESYKNHNSFEECFLQANDIIMISKKKLELCQSVNGTSLTLQSRMERIQTILTKELINNDQQENKVFINLLAIKEKMDDTVGDIEKEIINERTNKLITDRKLLQEKMVVRRNELEKSFTNIEKFKENYDRFSADITKVKNRLQNCSELEQEEIESLAEPIYELNRTASCIEETALEILQTTDNQLPIHMTKNMQKQMEFLSSKQTQLSNNCKNLANIQEQFDDAEGRLNHIIQNNKELVDGLLNKWNNAQNFLECKNITKEMQKICSDCVKTSLLSEELENLLSRFHDFPTQSKKNKTRFSVFQLTQNNFYNSLNKIISSNEAELDEYKIISDTLLHLEDEIKSCTLPNNDDLPESKLGKFNLINDLNCQKCRQIVFNKDVNAINTKGLNKKKLSEVLTEEKVKMIKETERNINDIDKRLNILNACLLSQEQLEKDILEIKESIYCIESVKLTLLLKLKQNVRDTKDTLNEIDKNISLIISIKKQIIKSIAPTQTGCYIEIQELQELKTKMENLDSDFQEFKEKFEIKTKKLMCIENNIIKLEKGLQYFEEEINTLTSYGSTIDNKRSLLQKLKGVSQQMLEEDVQLQSMKYEIQEIGSQNDGTLDVEKIFEKLEKKYLDQNEKVNLIIRSHEKSILDHCKFEVLSKEIIDEFQDIKDKLKCQSIEIDINDIESIGNVRDSYEELLLIGEKCQKTSSEEGKNIILRQLDNTKKNWKSIEQLHKQLRTNIENNKIHCLELEKQQVQLKEWLQEIGKELTDLKSFIAKNADEKRMKYINSKKILNNIQEWKKEVNKYFDTLKESNNKESEIEINMLKDYRHMLSEINGQVSESKEAVNNHLQFEKDVEEFTKRMDVTENQILELKPQTAGNLEEVEKQLKRYRNIEIKIMNDSSMFNELKHGLSKLVSHTSREGQEEIKMKILELEKRYEHLQSSLKIVIKNVQIEKEQIIKFEAEFDIFETWLSEMEGKFTDRSLVKDINEKERKLKKYQDYLLNIYDKKEDINNLLKTIKELPLNLTIHHNLRSLQIRYSSLSNSAQSQLEMVAKWESNHRNFLQYQEEFSKELKFVESKIKTLEDNIESSQNVEDLLQSINEVEKGINKIVDFKITYETSYHQAIQETCSSGHEDLKIIFIKDTKRCSEAVAVLKSIKSEVIERQNQERNIKNILEIIQKWIRNLKQELSPEKFSTADIIIIKSNGILLSTFIENINSKISFLENSKKENSAVKTEKIVKILYETEKELSDIYKELKELNANTEKLKEQNETFYQLYDSMKVWIESMNRNIEQISVTKGTESEIDERLTLAIEYRKSVSYQGKSFMENIIDKANSFMKYVTEKSNKEIILGEVNKIEEEFQILSKTADGTEENLNKVGKQWINYKINIDNLAKFVKTTQKKKQQLLEIHKHYGSNLDNCIDQLMDLINEISGEKLKLEILINQTYTLKELSQEPQVEQTVQDFMDQVIEQEIDCKYQLDRLYQLKNEKEIFDKQYHETKECIQNMKSDLIVFDQLHDIPSFEEFQKHFSNFQIFETKTIVCDRNVEDCCQIAYKLSTLCDGEIELDEMMKVLQKSWNNLKDKIGEIKSRLSRLANIWTTLNNLYETVDDWTNKSTSEVEGLMSRGYVNEELKDKSLAQLKELNSNGALLKPKLPKILDLFYKAESYTAFTKTGDPLILQKRFCDIFDKIWNLEKQLNSTQNNLDKFFEDSAEIEKWIIETSLIITNKYNATERINNNDEIFNQLKFCMDLRQQIVTFEEDKVKELIKLKEFIDKQLLNRSPLKSNIDTKVSEISETLKKLYSVNEKWKKSLKKRSDKLKYFQSLIQRTEKLIYNELPDWWSAKEITTTLSPENCDQQLKEALTFLDNVVSNESDFHRVWLDYTQQRQVRRLSQSMDADSKSSGSILSESLEITGDNHLDQIRTNLKESKNRIRQRLEELKVHKTKWMQIENNLEELESVLSQEYLGIESLMNVQDEDEAMYDQLETRITEIISHRELLDKIQEDINELNGNNDYNDIYSKNQYKKYQKVCKDYAGLLHKVDMLKGNLRKLNVNNAMKNILRSDIARDLSQSLFRENLEQLYHQHGTQTNRNKSTSIRTLKRHLSNPNLMLSKSRQPSETMNDLRKSIDAGSMTSHPYLSKVVQTVKDKGVQSKPKNMTLSEYAELVMKDRTSFEKSESSHKSNNKREHKEEKFRKLSEMLSTIQQIKDDVVSSKSYNHVPKIKGKIAGQNSPTRTSTESVRHNVTQKKKKVASKHKRSKSRESLGPRTSPTGCASPKSVKGEKMKDSPKRSLSRSSVNRLIAF